MTERWVRTVLDMSETTDRGLHYYVLPDAPVAALNVLREAAGLGPWREDGEAPWLATAQVAIPGSPAALETHCLHDLVDPVDDVLHDDGRPVGLQ